MKSESVEVVEASDCPESMSERQKSGSSGTTKADSGFCSSFKSKRYRDKLRSEIKSLDSLLPVDRSALHRKLDSQTVFRLVIAFFRTKVFFKAVGFPDDEAVSDVEDELDKAEDAIEENDPLTRELLKGDNMLQALDGFLLVAMADGTIVYVSDSVLQHLGFNQIDLMHRCLYSVLHPDDHYDVREVFEQTIPDNGFMGLQADSFCERLSQIKDRAEAISFLCRMRCFNGTTAGYLKMHCSGRIQVLPDFTKTAKCPNQIIFAFCRPFMMSGQDMEYDIKQNVFWTKHDMDLAFKQLDKKAADVIGYITEDVDGESFYGYIHPEDITTCSVCHKALMESTEIQTMYFRIQTKAGQWVWLHSRGKVVTKNSKKYSIVFSHYPVREDDSSYIQQEVILRQRYAINELFCLRQNNFHLDSATSSDSMFEMISQKISTKKAATRSLTSSANSYLDEFVTSQDVCPSSWHMMSERHSPVLPSTHVAHKISLREKQIHFQDFKKRQLEHSLRQRKDYQSTGNLNVGACRRYDDGGFSVVQGMSPEGTVFYGQVRQEPDTFPLIQSCPPGAYNCLNATSTNVNPYCQEGYATPELSPETVGDLNIRSEACRYNSGQVECPPHAYPSHALNPTGAYGMPPSPPPSPQQHVHHQECLAQDRTVHVRNVFTHHPSGGYTWVQDQTYRVRSHGNHNVKYGGHYLAQGTGPSPNLPRASSRSIRKKRQKSSDSKSLNQVSNQCYMSQSQTTPLTNGIHPTIDMCKKQDTNHRGLLPLSQCQEQVNFVTWDIPDIHSCAVASGCCEPGDRTPSCFDPAFHMAIVDDPAEIPSKADLDLPSIGSFLEYLNDI